MERDVGFVGDARVAVQVLVDEHELMKRTVGDERPRLHLAVYEPAAHGVVDFERPSEAHERLAAVRLPAALAGGPI